MADGVFQQDWGKQIGDALLLRHQKQQEQKALVQQKSLEEMKLRAGLAEHGAFSVPNVGPTLPGQAPLGAAPITGQDLLSYIHGGALPAGTTFSPNTIAAGEARNQTQKDIAGGKNAEDLKKLAIEQRTHWAQMLPAGQTKPASYFAPASVLQQYGIDPNEKIGSAQRPAGAGGKGGAGGKDDIKASDVQKLIANVRAQFKDAGWISAHFGDASRLPAVQQALQDIETGVTAKTIKTADDVDHAILASVQKGTIKGDEARKLRQAFHGGKE